MNLPCLLSDQFLQAWIREPHTAMGRLPHKYWDQCTEVGFICFLCSFNILSLINHPVLVYSSTQMMWELFPPSRRTGIKRVGQFIFAFECKCIQLLGVINLIVNVDISLFLRYCLTSVISAAWTPVISASRSVLKPECIKVHEYNVTFLNDVMF